MPTKKKKDGDTSAAPVATMAPTIRSRVLVFILTFASYAFFHCGRKAFSAIKPIFVNATIYPPDGYLDVYGLCVVQHRHRAGRLRRGDTRGD